MSEYIRGEMPLANQNHTFSGFLKRSSFCTAFAIVVLLMPILVFCTSIGWFAALIITFIVGVVITPAFKLGGGWIATLIGLSVLAGMIGVFSSLL